MLKPDPQDMAMLDIGEPTVQVGIPVNNNGNEVAENTTHLLKWKSKADNDEDSYTLRPNPFTPLFKKAKNDKVTDLNEHQEDEELQQACLTHLL